MCYIQTINPHKNFWLSCYLLNEVIVETEKFWKWISNGGHDLILLLSENYFFFHKLKEIINKVNRYNLKRVVIFMRQIPFCRSKTLWPIVLVWVAIAMMSQHDQQKFQGKRFYFAYAYISVAYQWRNWGQELKHGRNMVARADTEAMHGECCLLTYFPWLCSNCLYVQFRTSS